MKKKTVKSASIGITAAAAVGAALLLPSAQAATNEETIVDPGDPVMRCEGERIRGGYKCENIRSEVVSSKEVNLPPEKVTDDVAGCHPGNQPSVAKVISYSKTATVSVNVSFKFDLKFLTGATGVFNKLKELGPGVGVGASWSWSTTFGTNKNYTIPADYGKISWGTFSQRAIESLVDHTIIVRDQHIGYNVNDRYTARKMPVVIPVEEEKTKFPQGTLAKDQRDFKSVEEFKELCPNGVLPKYLGGEDPGAGEPDPGKPDPGKPDPGKPDPGKPDPGKPDPGEPGPGKPGALPCDSFLKVVAAGSDAKVISSNVRTDLENKCKNIQAHIQNGGDPASLVTELQRSIQKGESDGHINREYSHKLDAEAKALLNAKS